MMGRHDPARAFDALTAEESKLSGSQLGLKRAVTAAEQALKTAGLDRTTAESEVMRGRPDRREHAARHEQACLEELATAERRVTACEEAIAAARMERGQLVQRERDSFFLPDAKKKDDAVQTAAANCLRALNDLQSAARAAAVAVDRMRPRDRTFGDFVGGEGTRLRFDANAVAQWLTVAAERGVQWSSDVDAETGAPVPRHVLVAARLRALGGG
jgi:hypothetical protein